MESIENILRMHWMRAGLEALNGAAYLQNDYFLIHL
jgi:hypothetical protein